MCLSLLADTLTIIKIFAMKRQQAVFSIQTSLRGRTVSRSSTNRLSGGTDSVTSGHSYAGAFHFADEASQSVEYENDDNGNMTKDLNRGITGITYNALNLPSVVSFADNSYIEYTYSADGQKLRTRYGVQPGLGPLTPADAGGSILAGETAGTDAVETVPPTDELNRVDYCGNMVYDRGERRLLFENGYVTFDITTNAPSYHFYLRDHLGNNRVVMAGDGTVEQVTHYYPFGGVMRESTNPGLQPYKYGGKELDRTSGLDAYDFGARMYFADRLQWGQMDPLCEKYYDVSPYVYCGNKPLNLVDPDGETPISAIIEGVGSFMISAGVSFLENWLIDKKDFKTAFKKINWGAAAFDAISTATMSFFVDGTGSAKNLSKIASSKIGRITIDITQNMTSNIISGIEKGEKLDAHNLLSHFYSSIVSTLTSQGMGKRADELLSELRTNNKKLYNSVMRLQKHTQQSKSEIRLKRDKNKVDIAKTNANNSAIKYGSVRLNQFSVSKLSGTIFERLINML